MTSNQSAGSPVSIGRLLRCTLSAFMVAASPACTGSSGSGVDVLITEFCAGETDRTDSYGQFSDWIELENGGSEVLNLGGFGLSDDDRDPYRWTFPYLLVGPGERLSVQASGRG
jgi:hypothetical protein